MELSTAGKRLVAATLLLVISAAPSWAQGTQDIRRTIDREARAAQSSIQNAPQVAAPENPYKLPAIALLVAGAGIAVYGFTHTSGAEAEFGENSFTVKEKKSTGIGVAGVVVAAAGGVLWWKGEQKARALRPQVSVGLSRVSFGGQVRW